MYLKKVKIFSVLQGGSQDRLHLAVQLPPLAGGAAGGECAGPRPRLRRWRHGGRGGELRGQAHVHVEQSHGSGQ